MTVLSHEKVGVFDTATLDAKDPAALRAWLDANGFRAPDGIDGVVAEYLREGWVFVASKVHRDADDAEVRRIHPLAFTFPAKDAVYPMRLTGAANESLALDLYVAGDRRAEAEGLVVEYCGSTEPKGDFFEGTPDIEGSWQVHEPGEFGKRCDGTTVLTKLSGVMDRREMARDIAIRWTEFRPQRISYVADDVAWDRARLPGGCAFAVALLVAALAASRNASRSLRWTKFDTGAVAGALIVAGASMFVSYHFEPRMPAGVTVSERWNWFSDEEMTPPFDLRGDESAIRAWMSERMKGVINAATGEPVREEDSPGNWGLREREGRLELLFDRWPHGTRVLDVSRRVRFEGTIRSDGGSPVAGASVMFESLGPSYEGSWPAVRSDSDGRYRLDLPVGNRWRLYVVPDANPCLMVPDLDSSAPRSTPLDLTLPAERVLRGRVVDAEGRPVAGVGLSVYPPAYRWEVSQTARTSADGSFQFGGIAVAAGSVRIAWSRSRGRHSTRSFDVGPNAPPIEIVLEAE